MQPRSSGQCAATRSANAAVLQVSRDGTQLRPDWRSSAVTGPIAWANSSEAGMLRRKRPAKRWCRLKADDSARQSCYAGLAPIF